MFFSFDSLFLPSSTRPFPVVTATALIPLPFSPLPMIAPLYRSEVERATERHASSTSKTDVQSISGKAKAQVETSAKTHGEDNPTGCLCFK